MTTALETTGTKQLATTEDILKQAKNEVGANRVPAMPKLKISYDGEAAPEGEFFVQYVWEGDKQTLHVGAQPEVTILRRNVAYSYYNDKQDKLETFTNEIPESDGWLVMNTPIWLLRVFPNKAIEFFGEYAQFTAWRKQDETRQKQLKFTNVLYVLVEHEDLPEGKMLCQFFVSATSFSGEMNDPHPDHRNFEHFRTQVRASEPGVYFGTKCRLSTIERGGSTETNKKEKKIRYFLINFEAAGPSDLDFAAQEYQILSQNLNEKYMTMFANLPRESKVLEEAKNMDDEPIGNDGLPF